MGNLRCGMFTLVEMLESMRWGEAKLTFRQLACPGHVHLTQNVTRYILTYVAGAGHTSIRAEEVFHDVNYA